MSSKVVREFGSAPAKRSKYGARKVVVDGEKFDSQREANRYFQLVLEERAGEIKGLQRQVKFPLDIVDPNGTRKHIFNYVADFVYFRDGQRVVEDAKGYRTKEYRIKKKAIEAQYGFTILET